MKTDPVKLPEAGELLAVEALDRTGLAITSEGALVRILQVIPPNPLILSGARPRARSRVTFCHMAGRLRPGQSLQFYVQARPVNLDEVLAACAARGRRPGRASRQPPISPPATRSRSARWRLYAAMEESLRLHADDQAAVQFNALRGRPVRSPTSAPPELSCNELRPRGRATCDPVRSSATSRRTAARCARASPTPTRSAASSTRCRCPLGCSTARRWPSCCGRGSTRPRRDSSARRPALEIEVLGELDGLDRARGGPDRGHQAARRDRAIEPGFRSIEAPRRDRPRPRADDLRGHHRGRDHDGLADGRHDDPPALLAERVRARARSAPRAPAAEDGLPAHLHDQPRGRVARPRARLRPLRAGEREPAAA